MTDSAPIVGMIYRGRENGTPRLVTVIKPASARNAARIYYRRKTMSSWGSQTSCLDATWRNWVGDSEPEKGPGG